jgi:dinuclear metal center YbgI/SA1388 family protein
MNIHISDIVRHLQSQAPLHYAESFDNVGLLTGNHNWIVTGILVTLDTLEEVVDEAIAKKCNLIVSFHPIIFNALKSLTGKNYVERTVIKAIQNNIAIYALHTALDNQKWGVSGKMASVLGIENHNVLVPQKQIIKKLTTYVPQAHAEQVRKALFNAGAGYIGNYSECSFNSSGIGTYLPNEMAHPSIGEIGKLQEESETQIGVYFEKHLESKLLNALFETHPYEEVAYEVMTLDNEHQNIGMGIVGTLASAVSESDFMQLLMQKFDLKNIRHSKFIDKSIQKVAVLGGSGSFALKSAIAAGANAYVSADFKYHEFYGAENQILIADIGHYESEKFTKNLILEFIQKKFTTFAVQISETNTNPVFNYH